MPRARSAVATKKMALSEDVCRSLGGSIKETLIYELELLAAVLSLHLWCKNGDSNIHVGFGDNHSVRYALIIRWFLQTGLAKAIFIPLVVSSFPLLAFSILGVMSRINWSGVGWNRRNTSLAWLRCMGLWLQGQFGLQFWLAENRSSLWTTTPQKRPSSKELHTTNITGRCWYLWNSLNRKAAVGLGLLGCRHIPIQQMSRPGVSIQVSFQR